MRVLLFGVIAEKAGSESIEVNATSMASLRETLRSRIDGFDALSYAIAVNRRIVKDDMTFAGSEEIAVLPPFAGG
ncbi:MAG: MoaD/ThiS family protein [Flavobacteriales bacterium]|nr:MoaD/ThiS family protein [Flavobacteriales bacterium]